MRIPAAEDRPLLSVWPEAAPLFRIGRSTAYMLAEAGEFPVEVLRVGGRLFVRTADVRDYFHLDHMDQG
jgi:predicted DNA-binding transcriptional regulator AlpA